MNSNSDSIALLEDLGLAELSRRGRRKAPLAVEYVRDLTREDIDRVANGELPAILEGVELRALSTKHHTLAQMLASGAKQIDSGIATGFTAARVHQLTNDPQFAQLVEYYRSQGEARYLNVHERLGTLGMSAVDELQHRLEHEPEKVTTREVREILEAAMDRSIAPAKGQRGGGSSSGNAPVQVNISFPGADTTGARAPITIDGKSTEIDDEP